MTFGALRHVVMNLHYPPMVIPTQPIIGWGGTAATAVSASFTPSRAPNTKLIAFVVGTDGSAFANAGATIKDSINGVWKQIGGNFDGPNSSNWIRGRLFYHIVTGSPLARTITITRDAANNGINAMVVQCINIGETFNVQFAASTTSSPSLTMLNLRATSGVLGFWFSQVGSSSLSASPSGYTQLQAPADFGPGDSVACHYDISSPGPVLSWTGGDASNGLGVGLEITQP